MRRAATLVPFLYTFARRAGADRQVFQDGTAVAYPMIASPPTEKGTFYDGVWAKVLTGVTTECKMCPDELCSDKAAYPSVTMFRAMCWVNGSAVEDESMWLRSEEGCFVTVKDTYKYQRDYKLDIRECDAVPAKPKTRVDAVIRSSTVCRRCPNAQCDVRKLYQRSAQINLVCKAQALEDCLNDCERPSWRSPDTNPNYTWSKTSDNCYIPNDGLGGGEKQETSAGLETANSGFFDTLIAWLGLGGSKPAGAGRARLAVDLEDCGPVPFLTSGSRTPQAPVCEEKVSTATVVVTQMQTTTYIMQPPTCSGCPPLIFGYEPGATLREVPRPKTIDGPEPTPEPPAPTPLQMQPAQNEAPKPVEAASLPPAPTPLQAPPKPVEAAPSGPAPQPVVMAPASPNRTSAVVAAPAPTPLEPAAAPAPKPVEAADAKSVSAPTPAPLKVAVTEKTPDGHEGPRPALAAQKASKGANKEAEKAAAPVPVALAPYTPWFVHVASANMAEAIADDWAASVSAGSAKSAEAVVENGAASALAEAPPQKAITDNWVDSLYEVTLSS